jgi:phosphoribosyl-ATP pyrophosphohydrolase
MTQPCTVLDKLYDAIASRRSADPATSYTAQLMSEGTAKCAQKIGEEAVEAAIAAIQNKHEDLVCESADLIYHLLVLLAVQDVKPSEVYAELARRQGCSGLEEKARRKNAPA